MYKKILFILIIVTSFKIVLAQDVQQYIDSAKIYYTNSEYDKAIEMYKKVLLAGKESGFLYYNLGNAYYKENKITDAILNYERAKLYIPNNKDLLFNLEMANRRITDKIDAVPEFFIITWWKAFIGIFTSDTWSIISMISFILFLSSVFLFFFTRTYSLKGISFWLGIVLIIISISSFIFAGKTKMTIEKHNTAIIFESVINVKSSPGDVGTELFVIHEGTKVEITQTSGEWIEIKLANGNKGWVKRDLVEII